MRNIVIIGGIVASLCSSLSAQGTLMRYSFEGTASGNLGAQQFTNASFRIVGIADTANLVVSPGSPGKPVSHVTNTVTFVDLPGIGSGVLLDTVQTVDNKVTGLVGFGDLTQFTGLLFGRSPLFASYALTEPIGPVPVELNSFLVFDSEPTTAGELRLGSYSSMTFQAMAVPEPSCWFLSALGVAVMGGAFWRRKRQNRRPNTR